MAEERSWGDFFKDNATLLVGGGLGLGAFMLSNGGFLGMLLAAAAFGGTMMFGGALMNKAQDILPESWQKSLGLASKSPKKNLDIAIALDKENPKNPVITIDGLDYEVTLETKKGDGRAIVEKATYKLVGADESTRKDVKLPTAEAARIVGAMGPNGPIIELEKLAKVVADPIAAAERTAGRAAKDALGITGFHPVNKEQTTFAFKAGGEEAYIVEVDKKTGSFVLKDAATNRELKTVTGITDPEALEDGGPLNRLVARALQEYKADTASLSVAKIDKAKPGLAVPGYAISTINAGTIEESKIEGTFAVDKTEAAFELQRDGAHKLKELTILRNGRKIAVDASSAPVVGAYEEVASGATEFTLKADVLKPLLEKAIKADDAEVAKYAAPLEKISLGAPAAEEKYIYNSKSGFFKITTTDTGYSIFDKDSNAVPEGSATDIKGGKDAVLREVFHKLKELKVSPDAAPAKGSEGLAINTNPNIGLPLQAAALSQAQV